MANVASKMAEAIRLLAALLNRFLINVLLNHPSDSQHKNKHENMQFTRTTTKILQLSNAP